MRRTLSASSGSVLVQDNSEYSKHENTLPKSMLLHWRQ